VVKLLRILVLLFPATVLLGASAISLIPTVPASGQPTEARTAADLAYRELASRSAGQGSVVSPLNVTRPIIPSAPLERLRIPAIGVDAPVAKAGRDPRGVMDVPADAKTVVWYDFTGDPGTGSNAVFAGHVDYAGVGPAVFWDLRRLRFGDLIDVSRSDGTVYRYKVVSSQAYSLSEAPVMDIIGPTAFDAITLITCTGTFNSALRQYDQRLVVRAQRVW
jgi:LPXTG-site transpeptidase (sortase) family protein